MVSEFDEVVQDENPVGLANRYSPHVHAQLQRLARILTTVCSTVILLPAHPASFAHNFVSGMQSFYFSESRDANPRRQVFSRRGSIVLQCTL